MSRIRKRLKKIALIISSVALAAVGIVLIAGSTVTLTGEQVTPAGFKRNESLYLTMRDGVRIAVDVWYPPTIAPQDEVPTLVRATRYGRAQSIGFGLRSMVALGRLSSDPNLHNDVRVLNEAGYAVVRVDARGSGASFGDRPIEWSGEEVADYGEVIEWIVQQPWSNGRVGAYGVSYDGNAAELIAVSNHPALKAVAPMFSYFDPFQDLIRPGGVFDASFLERWSAVTHAMDTRLPCRQGMIACRRDKLMSDGIKPVDSDRDGSLRAAAISDRNNPVVMNSLEHMEFRDDDYGVSGGSFDERAPYHLAHEIQASGVAMNVWTGWYDSGAVDGALARYVSLSNPQQLIIGPFTHGGKHDADPYAAPDRRVQPDADEQYGLLAGFFDPFLKDGLPASELGREIHYYTLGENAWKRTRQWPPTGIATVRWYFAADGELRSDAPTASEQFDRYEVDFTATTGRRSRWHTIGGPDVVYPDRREADAKLLTYTSAPLLQDLEITGTAVVTLNVESSRDDAALHIYLEEVGPDGRVTYLTEGILRAANRKIASDPPYQVAGPYHSLRRGDAQPLVPGVATEIAVALYAISVRIPRNHRIRIAIAGANADVFERIPSEGDAVLTVHRSVSRPSFVDLPQLTPVGK